MIYNLGRVVPLFKGNYDAATTYGFLDVVYYDNSSFVALDTTTGNLPTDTSHWLPVALKGTTQDPTPSQMQEIINTVETYMEGNIVDNLSSTDTDKPLSANMGSRLNLQGTKLYFEGGDNTLKYGRVYCLANHTYRVWLDKNSWNWSNITYTSSSYLLFAITNVPYSGDAVSLFQRNCDDKVNPLLNFYDVKPTNNGYLRIGYRGNVGETLVIYIEDITNDRTNESDIDILNRAFLRKSQDMESAELFSGSYCSGSVGKVISQVSISGARNRKYAVVGGHYYYYMGKFTAGFYNYYSMFWTDANGVIIKRQHYINQTGSAQTLQYIERAPDNAVYLYVNYVASTNLTEPYYEVYELEVDNTILTDVDTLGDEIDGIDSRVDNLEDNMQYVSQMTPIENDAAITGRYYNAAIGSTMSTSANSLLYGRRYPVQGNTKYHFKNYYSAGFYGNYLWMLEWADENEIVLRKDYKSTQGVVDSYDTIVESPENAAYAYINYSSINNVAFDDLTFATVNVSALKNDVEDIREELDDLTDNSKKLMKVVLRGGFVPTNYDWTNAYYIRTKYNDSEDIIIQNQINGNGILSFYAVYIGPNDKTDEQLRTSTYMAVDCHDSTAPFLGVDLYWHLYAQHGCPIPTINNNVGMTSASVGTLWEDTITLSDQSTFTRQYHIGYVSSSTIYLLPVFYPDSYGRMTRGWKTRSSTAISQLNYVNAGTTGTDEGIRTITVSGYSALLQKKPMLKNSNRHFILDGREITEAGTYYCDELKISESQVGYDPATIADADWFSGSNNRVNLDNGALPLVEFTWSYLYKGANCAMNTTVKLLREIECNSYGALQQQYPWTSSGKVSYDNKTYQIKFLVPKHKTKNTPFNQPSSGFTYYRTSGYLVDVNDPVDRQICYLVNQNDNTDFRVGMAAGLSLVSGDTVREKRIQNIPIGDRPSGATAENSHWRLGSLSPGSDTLNKFYIAAINTANYQDNQYNLPVGYFKEINCYVSYFDPAQNFGQVYWYKDGNSYIIYCHAQSAAQNQVINVPNYMEGLNLSVVEKTSNAELLTNTITNGKFYVNYTGTDQVKYIVLKAQ